MVVKKKKIHYIDNKKFLGSLRDYKESCVSAEKDGLEDPAIPEYIGECFMKIANGLSFRPNFIGYSYKSEMISDAIENCLMYFRNFDPDKSKNPFSYFTTICYYAFVRRISKEKKQTMIKENLMARSDIFEEMITPDINGRVVIPNHLAKMQSEYQKNTSHKKKLKVAESKRVKKDVSMTTANVATNLEILLDS
jgi:hypothetical protein